MFLKSKWLQITIWRFSFAYAELSENFKKISEMDTIASAFGSLFGKKDNKRNSSIGPEVKQPQIPDSSPIVVKSEKERIGTFQSL
jgi:hypothetical protein